MKEIREAYIGDGSLKITSDGRAFTNRSMGKYPHTVEWHEVCVKDAPRKDLSKGQKRTNYKVVKVHYKDGRKEVYPLHRLVAECFVSNPDPERFNEVNHIDGNPNNNSADNLEWTTHYGNMRHAYDTGLIKYQHHYCKVCGKEFSKKNRKQQDLCPEHRKEYMYYRNGAPEEVQEHYREIVRSCGKGCIRVGRIIGVSDSMVLLWRSGKCKLSRKNLMILEQKIREGEI